MRSAALLFFASVLSAQSRQQVAQELQTCLPSADPVTVLSIVQVESHFRSQALNVNYPEHLARQYGYRSGWVTLERQPKNDAEARSWIPWLEANHLTLSVGLMQVNSVDARTLGVESVALLDPCTNLRTGWRIFVGHYRRAETRYGAGQTALRAALSAYNTGSFVSGFRNGYVRHVLLAAQR